MVPTEKPKFQFLFPDQKTKDEKLLKETKIIEASKKRKKEDNIPSNQLKPIQSMLNFG